MSNISVDYDVLNQRGSPAWFTDTFANIPTAGFVGRMFISTDTFAFYRDTGTGWDLIGGPGTGTITGSGVTGQVSFFNGTQVLAGNNNLFWDNTNSRLGINTTTPGQPLDIHSTGNTLIQLNNTTTANSNISFQNQNVAKWRVGNVYNGGANSFDIQNAGLSTNAISINSTTNNVNFGSTIGNGTFTYTLPSATGTLALTSNIPANPVGGTGTINTLPKFTAASTIGNSNITDTGSLITLGSNSYVNGNVTIPNASYYYSLTSTATTVRLLGINSGNVAYVGAIDAGVVSTIFNASSTSLTASFYTSGTEKVTINSVGSVGIGITSLTGYNLRVGKNITGGTTSYGIAQTGSVQSDVTSVLYSFYSQTNTATASFTLGTYIHYMSDTASLGAGSTITNQYGFFAQSSLTNATNNYGFFGNIPSGTNRWNLYMDGTANNYMAGSLGIGSTSLTGYNLRISKTLTGLTSTTSVFVDGITQADSTNYGNAFRSSVGLAASATTTNLIHYIVIQGSFGAGSSATNQTGFWVENLTGATNNYGFYGNIVAGANRWNIYMAGTAANYMAGKLGIGITNAAYELDVFSATANVTIGSNTNNNGFSGIVTTYNSAYGNFIQMRSYGNTTGATLFGISTNGMNSLWSNGDTIYTIGTIGATAMVFGTNNTERYRITSTGINNYTSRGNYLGATDNALFSLNSGGTLYTVGFSPTATASSTNTFTITNGTTTWIYTGSGAATWTLPNPSGNNQIYWIKNAGTGAITLTAFSGTNIINNSAASVSTISIAVGATAVIAQDGNVKSYQLQ